MRVVKPFPDTQEDGSVAYKTEHCKSPCYVLPKEGQCVEVCHYFTSHHIKLDVGQVGCTEDEDCGS